MTRIINATDVKWGYSRELCGNLAEDLMNSICVFIGEVLRSDEIGLLVWKQQPVLMVKISEVNLETRDHYVKTYGFEGSKIKDFLDLFNFPNYPTISIGGFEILCYRPKPNNPYHPKIHPTYTRAKEKSSRVLSVIFVVTLFPDENINAISLAQVDIKLFDKFFKTAREETIRRKTDEMICEFQQAVELWIGEFYTDKVGSSKYKAKNRYPLAPEPLEDTKLFVFTTDDDGNPMFYQTQT